MYKLDPVPADDRDEDDMSFADFRTMPPPGPGSGKYDNDYE